MADNRFDDFEQKASEADPFGPDHSSAGWAIIGGLFLLACGLWVFSGPTYIQRFVLDQSSTSAETSPSSEKESTEVTGGGDGTIPGRKPGEMAIVFMNVKYGDGILVQSPDNTTSLIDGGEGGDPDDESVPAYDWAYELYLPLFRELGINELEHVISTVPLSHHMGAQPDLVSSEDVSVNNVHRTGYPASFYSYRRLELEAGNKDLELKSLDPGERLDFGPGIKSQVLFGQDDVKMADAASHVIYLKYGDVRFLLMSDLPSEKEKKLVLRWADSLDADVIKVGKHGSRDSTSMELLQYVKPSYAVISVSRRNPLRAPHDELLKRLEKGGVKNRRVFRTDTNGHVAIFTDGDKIRVQENALSQAVD